MKSFRTLKLLCVFLFLFSSITTAQWSQTNGPNGGEATALIIHESTGDSTALFAGTKWGGIFRSANLGLNWTAANNGLVSLNWDYFFDFAEVGDIVFAAGKSGVYKTTNNGELWTAVNTINDPTSTNVNFLPAVYCLAIRGNNIFAGTYNGVYRMPINGNQWTKRLENVVSYRVNALAVSGNTFYVGTIHGIYRAKVGGVDTFLDGKNINAFKVGGNNIFAGTNDTLFYSSNGGNTWEPHTDIKTRNITEFAGTGDNLFASAGSRVIRSTDRGKTWEFRDDDLPHMMWYSLAVKDNFVIAGNYGCGIFLSTDNGNKWNREVNGFSNTTVNDLLTRGSGIYAGLSTYGVVHSNDGGQNWISTPGAPSYCYSHTNALAQDYDYIYAGNHASDKGVFRFSPGGQQSSPQLLLNKPIGTLTVRLNSGGIPYLFAGTLVDGVELSTNNGNYWQPKPANIDLPGRELRSLTVYGNNLFAGMHHDGTATQFSLYRSTNNAEIWTPVNSQGTVEDFAKIGAYLFAATSSTVLRSTDDGVSWLTTQQIMLLEELEEGDPLNVGYVFCLEAVDNNLFAGTQRGVYLSTDYGVNWEAKNESLENTRIQSLERCGYYLYAGTDGRGIWRRPLIQMIPMELTAELSRGPMTITMNLIVSLNNITDRGILSKKQSQFLKSILKDASRDFGNGRMKGAIHNMTVFIQQVEMYIRNNVLTEDQGQFLMQEARNAMF